MFDIRESHADGHLHLYICNVEYTRWIPPCIDTVWGSSILINNQSVIFPILLISARQCNPVDLSTYQKGEIRTRSISIFSLILPSLYLAIFQFLLQLINFLLVSGEVVDKIIPHLGVVFVLLLTLPGPVSDSEWS